jgi:hypothetical protein
MTPKEFVEAIRKELETEIGEEIQGFQFEHGWILKRVTSYLDKEGKVRVCFNFEVRL